MSVSSRPERAEKQELAGNGRGSKGCRAPGRRRKGQRAHLDFIPFSLYYISATFGCILLSEGDDG